MNDLLQTLSADLDECVELLRSHYPDECDEALRGRAAQDWRAAYYSKGRWPTDQEIEAKKAKEAEEAAAAASAPAPIEIMA
jgi:hypothetical protein